MKDQHSRHESGVNFSDSQDYNRPLNILIIEAYTIANIGSCALVENSIKILESKFKNSKIKTMAHNPKSFAEHYHQIFIEDVFQYPYQQSRPKQMIWLLKTVTWMSISLIACKWLSTKKSVIGGRYPFRKKIAPFLWADLVVSVGAERLNDKYYKNVLFSLFTYYIVKVLKKKMVIFPSTIGPLFFRWSKWLTRKVLNKVDIIYTRDNLSAQIADNLLNLPRKKIIDAPDVAVIQESIEKKESLRMISLTNEEKIVGISAMRWIYFKNRIETPFSNYDAYKKEMAITADTIIDDYGVNVVFYPTNFPLFGCIEDDLVTAHEVFSLMKNQEKAKVINKLPTPSQLKGMLGCSQVNITTRMHACILSTSAYVPTISVNYLFKVREYMDSLGLSEFSIDIEEFCAEKALRAFAKIWPERERWNSLIKKMIIQKRDRLWKSMELLDVLVSK